jgi:hypothetical protein
VIRGDDLAQILGIEPRRERGRADQVTEHHGELPPFGGGGNGDYPRFCYRFRIAFVAQRSDRPEQSAAMPDEADAKIL